ncbi:hypothetical protein Q1695_006498 [Nippostrongylus brasiliensis]|nr:hypothetical protein Q1695_006498 [Nippostrongylus brasiliensis]
MPTMVAVTCDGLTGESDESLRRKKRGVAETDVPIKKSKPNFATASTRGEPLRKRVVTGTITITDAAKKPQRKRPGESHLS